MKKILVVGQTPPPHGGQAIMIENMLRAKFTKVKFYHLRMAFSADMEEVGKFKIGKIIKLLQLVLSIYYYRLRYNVNTLYYPPAPPQKVPMFRDVIILNASRWLFKTIIFHFHAAGISEMHSSLNGYMKKLYERAYFYPDVCIRLSEFNPEDGKFLKTKKEFIVPNGLDDIAGPYLHLPKKEKVPVLLSVGVLCESKGVLVLLESAHLLAKRNIDFKLQFMGRFESEEFRIKVMNFIKDNILDSYIKFIGVCTGEDKCKAFNEADIFCFPTFFEAETFGLVALEAMQFELPVVASRWRGVPSVVSDQQSGFLVPPHDAQAMADKLEVLIKDPALRKKMGREGREIYKNKFTSEKHFELLENAFSLA